MSTTNDSLKTQAALQGCLDRALPRGTWRKGLAFLRQSGETVDDRQHALRSLTRFRQLARQGATPIERQMRQENGSWKPVAGKQLDLDLDLRAETLTSAETGGYGMASTEGSLFLSLAVTWKDLPSLRWALRCGFDPGRFDHSAGSTPMGQAAYGSQVDVVRLFWSWGADPTLLVTGAFGEQPRYHGSTLLHRLFESNRQRTPEAAQVATFLIDVYPDPLVRDRQGLTFLDWADAAPGGPVVAAARQALAARVAREQSHALRQTLPGHHPLRVPRHRL